MIRKIILENFMSHKRTVIEPAEGLTVLAGPNNCGKSAIVVALQTLCFNDRGSKAYVRHGEKESRVRVETDDGHRLEWIRKGDVVSYKIDGRDVNRLKGGVPEDLHELLRLGKVEDASGDFEFDIHFAEQKSPIFLLDQPGSRAATFFAASSDAGLLLQMQQHHKDREREVKGQERTLQANVAASRREMKRYESLPLLQEMVKAAELQHQELSRKLTSARELVTKIIEQDRTRVKVQVQAVVCETLNRLGQVPLMQDEGSLQELCLRLSERRREAALGKARFTAVSKLGEPPEMSDAALLERTIGELHAKQDIAAKMAAEAAKLRKVQTPPELPDVDLLSRHCALISAKSSVVKLLARSVNIAEQAVLPPALQETRGISDAVEKISRHRQDVSVREIQLTQIELELNKMRQTIRAFVEKHPVCPLCGSKLTADQILNTGGHAHA